MKKTDILARLRMTSLAEHTTARGGCAWSGIITLDGAPVFRVGNDGNGGCNDYCPAAGDDYRGMREQLDVIEAAAVDATGHKMEAFDSLTSCMQNGTTAREAVATVASWT